MPCSIPGSTGAYCGIFLAFGTSAFGYGTR